MIYIDRKSATVPPYLTDLQGAAAREIAYAKQFYKLLKGKKSRRKTKISPPKYKAYRNPLVKDEIKLLFREKCAFCECKVTTGSRGDVEHFRPKGMVVEKQPQAPGYYWLAAKWENLLLSCNNCNSRGTQTIEGAKKVTGKGNHFPLKTPGKHVKGPRGNVSKEEKYRLLVNPCVDKPETLFIFDEFEAYILPKHKIGFKNGKAEKSIEIYGLQRSQLVVDRKIVLLNCFDQIDRVNRAIRAFNRARSNAEKNQHKRDMETEIEKFKVLCKPESPFSAIAKQIYNRYFAQYYYK